MTPHEIMRATDAIGKIGSAFYFHPDTVARGKEAGVDGFRFYFLGRGGVLGDVEADVVHAAFGYFSPALVERIWTSARERMAPRDAARLYIECGHEFARSKLSTVDDGALRGLVDALGTLVGAVEGAAMPLFAGVRAEPVPADAPAAALHQAMVVREMRGGAHLVALTACGVPTAVAHAIKRPGDVAMFGYDETPAVTDADRVNWQRAEALTDDILAPAYARLTPEQADALVAGTSAVAAGLGL